MHAGTAVAIICYRIGECFNDVLKIVVKCAKRCLFKKINKVPEKVSAVFMEHDDGFPKYHVTNPHRTLAV